jgi:hypothetical protein
MLIAMSAKFHLQIALANLSQKKEVPLLPGKYRRVQSQKEQTPGLFNELGSNTV